MSCYYHDFSFTSESKRRSHRKHKKHGLPPLTPPPPVIISVFNESLFDIIVKDISASLWGEFLWESEDQHEVKSYKSKDILLPCGSVDISFVAWDSGKKYPVTYKEVEPGQLIIYNPFRIYHPELYRRD